MVVALFSVSEDVIERKVQRPEDGPIDDVADETRRIHVRERRAHGRANRTESHGHHQNGESDPKNDAVTDACPERPERAAEVEVEDAHKAGECDAEDRAVDDVGREAGGSARQVIRRGNGDFEDWPHLDDHHRLHDGGDG